MQDATKEQGRSKGKNIHLDFTYLASRYCCFTRNKHGIKLYNLYLFDVLLSSSSFHPLSRHKTISSMLTKVQKKSILNYVMCIYSILTLFLASIPMDSPFVLHHQQAPQNPSNHDHHLLILLNDKTKENRRYQD